MSKVSLSKLVVAVTSQPTTWYVIGDQLTQPRGGRGTKMEGNRDEAEKCIKIASKAIEAGDKEKALKFLHKAEKLFPTDRAKGNAGSIGLG